MEKQSEITEQSVSVAISNGIVGVRASDDSHWFVAIVGNRSEIKNATAIEHLGYEVFVPTQTEIHDYRNRPSKTVLRILLPAKVFIRCTEKQRREIVNTPYVKRFAVDMTSVNNHGGHNLLVIPDNQIESFRIAIAHAEGKIMLEDTPFNLGDKVIVKSGEFIGMEGSIIVQPDGKKQIVVALGNLGCIKLSIPARCLKKKK